ncbi:HAD hydrolase-like protein [Terribacillus saccharophilus]|uniref:Nucleosidase n=1 Tax=Terribacillus saccharophilus TaxID=361277 RepID=A0ABX4H3V6_9BACI|nr:HAD hydrolase-like protein [Terribacillus saccharophilus]PAD34155.1 nucleosidase [Terribacillus saccharophilus]PAD98039.1 nucleosidase [Terribacillus saccharophilus]PAE01815.1 nucleosidase [Terribacillus saccharophilus]
MKTSVIFDMDGTLFQTNKILELSLDETFCHLRLLNLWDADTPIDTYRKIMGVPLPTVWETLLPEHSNEIRKQTDIYFLEKLVANIKSGNGALYQNVHEIFRFLKENDCDIFIASNGLTEYLQTIVTYYNLDKWVTETFSIQQIHTLNKGDLVKSIIDKYDIKAGAVVGDRISDISAAKDNGLVSIGCNFDFANETELAHADYIINNLNELQRLIDKIDLDSGRISKI